jgi:initiation factor 1A
MVRNKIGGNKAKKFARKNINASAQQNKKLRFAMDEDEMYGIVNKMVGNGQVVVMCADGKERLCFIRNKFSGRNKSSNLVSVGSWVIVGKRSWESVKADKLEKCDLLEIYNDNEKHRIQQECNVNFSALQMEEQKLSNVNDLEDAGAHANIDFNYKENEILEENNEDDNESFGSIDFDDI